MSRFPARMFRWAAIYGVVVLAPLYWLPLPPQGGEMMLGFIGLALVFQAMFWIIGGDPLRYRALMPVAVIEKLVFALPALALAARHYPIAPGLPIFASLDLLLGLGFLLAWRSTRAGKV